VRLQGVLADDDTRSSPGRGQSASGTRERMNVDPYLPLDQMAHVASHRVENDTDEQRQKLLEHWGLRAPVVVMQPGQGAQSDSLSRMLDSLKRRLSRAELEERTRQARIMATSLVANIQGKALESVSQKLGMRFRKPGAPRFILSLYDAQEKVGEVSMDLQHADWRRLQALIQSQFGWPAELGYYASDALEVGEEQLRELRRQSKSASAQFVTYQAPLQMSPARSKSSRLLRVCDKRSFEVLVVRAKSGGLFAMDETGGAPNLACVEGCAFQHGRALRGCRQRPAFACLLPLYLGRAP
jgi:hypothetical protein